MFENQRYRFCRVTKKALKKIIIMLNIILEKNIWGEKIQISIEELFKNNQLKKEVIEAKSKIN